MLKQKVLGIVGPTASGKTSLSIKLAHKFGGEVIMTSANHETGTDRIAEAALKLDADIVVNIQGDEALVNPEHVDKVVSELIDEPDLNVGILVNSFSKKNFHLFLPSLFNFTLTTSP